MKVHRNLSLVDQDFVAVTKQWKDIREGIKLRNIVQSKRINDFGIDLPRLESSKLIIQRHLGHKNLIPGAGQWGVYTEQKDECWICGLHIITLFVWTPRIGKLASTKESSTIEYYKKEMEKLRSTWRAPPSHETGVPFIFGQFTNWQPVQMQEVIPYCMKNDEDQPDFLQECINNGKIRPYCVGAEAEPLTYAESNALMIVKEAYYREHWHRIQIRRAHV